MAGRGTIHLGLEQFRLVRLLRELERSVIGRRELGYDLVEKSVGHALLSLGLEGEALLDGVSHEARSSNGGADLKHDVLGLLSVKLDLTQSAQ